MGRVALRVALLGLGMLAILAGKSTVSASDSCLYALDFDGAVFNADLVNIQTLNGLLIAGDMSIELWARPDSLGSLRDFLGHGAVSEQEVGNSLYYFRIDGSQILRFAWEYGGGQDEIALATVAAPIAAGEWHHLAVTRAVSSKEVMFFVDGVQLGTTVTYTNNPTGGSSGGLHLGHSAAELSFFAPFDGTLDQIRIWNDVRTPAEIQANMHKPLAPASEPNLVGYWKLDEASGQSVLDETSNGNNGTLGSSSAVEATDPVRTTSSAPIGDTTIDTHNDVGGMWLAQASTGSSGMQVQNNATTSFLNDLGDDLITGHNGQAGNTTNDLPSPTFDSGQRWQRIWYCDLSDMGANGGKVDITFDYDDAGMGASAPPSGDPGNYRLLRRDGTSGDFGVAASATAIDTGEKTVTFSGVDVGGLCSYLTLGTVDATSSPTAITLRQFTVDAGNLLAVLAIVVLSGLNVVTCAILRRRPGNGS